MCDNRACARGALRQNSVIYHREGLESVKGRCSAPNEARKADAVFADDIPMKVSASARQKLDSNSSRTRSAVAPASESENGGVRPGEPDVFKLNFIERRRHNMFLRAARLYRRRPTWDGEGQTESSRPRTHERANINFS